MIPPKIKNLFQFIGYLHSNIGNFNYYYPLVEKTTSLLFSKETLIKRTISRYQFDLENIEIDKELQHNYKIIRENIIEPIKAKALELKVCSFREEGPDYLVIKTDIHKFKKDLNDKDFHEIVKYHKQFGEYCSNENFSFNMFRLLYENIGKKLKELLDYFNETKEIQHKSFENTTNLDLSNNESIKLKASILFENRAVLEHISENITLSQNYNNQASQTPIEILNIKGVEEKKVKAFIEYLSHPRREQLAKSLKNEFETEKGGKNFALMIKSLQNRKILNLSIGSYSKLYNAIETYFNRKIGSEAVLNKFKTALINNFTAYSDDLDSINNRVEILLNDLEKE